MFDLLGFTCISLVSLITIFIALRYTDISKIILTALIVRIFFLLIGHYVTPLPDSTADAITFERLASRMSEEGLSEVLSQFRGPDPRFISWLIALPYSLFGRSILMAKSMSLLFGIGSVFLGWLVAKKIWNNRTANKVGWALALFPSLVLYSVIIMREVYIVFFLLLALYGVIGWVKTDSLKSILLAMTGFIFATFFHGGMFVGGIVFLSIIGISSLKRLFQLLINIRINLKILLFLTLFIVSAGFYLSNKISVPYLGSFETSTNIQILLDKTNIATRGVASWPEWLIISSPIEMIYKAPIRSIYVVFAPFPWDILKLKHLIGMFDAFLYMYLSYLVFKNRKVIWKDPTLKILLLILLSYIFVFGIGVGNFGTGIRHRSKFVVIFILLAAPLLKKFILSKDKEKIGNFKNILK